MDRNIKKISEIITEDPDVFNETQTEIEINYLLALVYSQLYKRSEVLFDKAQGIAENYGPEIFRGRNLASAASYAMSLFESDIEGLIKKHDLIEIIKSA